MERVANELLALLACPADDHGRLESQKKSSAGDSVLVCRECKRTYPVRGGIPILLLEEAVS